ncbi:unnamed protein product [Rhizophagus irregularis]|uniref:Uncharacterized protein n=1 Tax=Rhizophagus irregularis TaxID=588596 RepID=A0A915ZD86_9GLOM|nr:unnamed protein product [Rhizophagus irregularis]CAB5371593.1 unnamed protein product [Rhizophagus irregularis]
MKSPLLEPRSYELSSEQIIFNGRFSAQSASGLNSLEMISPGVELGICDSNVLRLGENDLEFIIIYVLTESNFRDCRSCCQRLSSERDLSFNLAADLFSKICPFSP